ncbi:Uncharacterised protein [Mycobacteroides abscessus subsp. abscessus]|nr:Uncharacterised protein [Mycobacteroides abscessus subsp. abscessus]SKV28678.1 Uncharacterised protein [Mycobacteroides abscessus subsp. abscessus]
MGPDRVALVDADGIGQPAPQVRRLAQLARAQLQPHQGREGLFGRAAGGAAPAQCLAEGRSRRDALAERVGHHGLHPALDQSQQGFQPLQGLFLLRCGFRFENTLGQNLFHL